MRQTARDYPRDLPARVAQYRVARRKLADHHMNRDCCARGLCSEGERLYGALEDITARLPFHALRMTYVPGITDDEVQDLKKSEPPMVAAIGVSILCGAVLIGIPFAVTLWPFWR